MSGFKNIFHKWWTVTNSNQRFHVNHLAMLLLKEPKNISHGVAFNVEDYMGAFFLPCVVILMK